MGLNLKSSVKEKRFMDYAVKLDAYTNSLLTHENAIRSLAGEVKAIRQLFAKALLEMFIDGEMSQETKKSIEKALGEV